MKQEAVIQTRIVDILSLIAERDGFIFFSVPNEGLLSGTGADGARSAAMLNALKRMGLTPGIPDLAIVSKGGSILFLEVKAPAGRLTTAQKAIHNRLNALKIPCEIVRDVEDALLALKKWEFIPPF